ncbi:hypothetical protein BUALT_Bualt13G0087200 [Buddleja alternifolia]|uniref:Uncharacterized protein n=1 Tax=Buddleja alternifolia TaxID=168488 RepID=A0AAV6WUB9_9LAMI|nr:hypothetical protein BUALT_Bualt13G0087200 [Buddleja alternifolia]
MGLPNKMGCESTSLCKIDLHAMLKSDLFEEVHKQEEPTREENNNNVNVSASLLEIKLPLSTGEEAEDDHRVEAAKHGKNLLDANHELLELVEAERLREEQVMQLPPPPLASEK